MADDDFEEVLFEDGLLKEEGPVECLGMTFENNEARRDYFLDILREKLRDPAFRKIEGFPIGEDEDILILSDPPYYTACPNPFLKEFVRHYGKPYDSETDEYHREPYATDVTAGKGDFLYSAHSYHTKVPPKAIVRYILHYTNPGDVVFDPFCGSGMTGLASLLCDSPVLMDTERELQGMEWGVRIPIMIDISPAATFISSVYAAPPPPKSFVNAATTLLNRTIDAYRTDWQFHGRDVSYYVKSEVFVCPVCQEKITSSNVTNMTDSIGSAATFLCPECEAQVSKAPTRLSSASRLTRYFVSIFDPYLGSAVRSRRERTIAVMFGEEKEPRFLYVDREESLSIDEGLACPNEWVPTYKLILGDRCVNKDCCPAYGITHVHHFYTQRQARYMSMLWHGAALSASYEIRRSLMFWVQSYGLGATRLNRFIPPRKGKEIPGSQVNRYFSGTLYIPSMLSEVSPEYLYRKKIQRLEKAFTAIRNVSPQKCLVSTQSATKSALPEESIDYIFIDPPFGRNLQYSELNQIWEAWLRLFTQRDTEAVVDETRARGVLEYGSLMRQCFVDMFTSLKPGRWMTLVFHNSFNAVWIAIQEALFSAGFIVADVRVLDKQQDTYKQSRQGLVKQDLVISAYKPNQGLEERFKLEEGTEEGAWDFTRAHLRQLPVFVEKDGKAEVVAERQNYLLFDRMVAFHVQRGVTVPLSAGEFYAGLPQRFPERDSMYFLPEQAAEYDKKRAKVAELVQLDLFVTDESSAIQWLKQQLEKKPQTFSELQPPFLKEIAGWEKYEKPLELSDLLNENFLFYDGKGDVPSQIHSYLSTNYKELRNLSKDDPALRAKAKGRYYVPDPGKAQDLEKLREKALLHEFEEYKASKAKKLKVFRIEAVRAGFKKAWQENDYDTIAEVAIKIPEKVLQEDSKLLMWYDVAVSRGGGE